MIKVLYVINNLGSGGAEKLIEELVPRINKIENVEADILLLTDKKNVFYDSLVNDGVKVDVIKYKRLYDPRNIIEIKNYIIRGKYDVVHSHIFPTQYWVALSKLFIGKRKVKFITTEHSTHNRRRDKFYFRYIDKFIYAQYDCIISITEKTKENLLDWIDPKRKHLDRHTVIENGVDIEKIKNAIPYKKNELIESINENTKLVCMVGRFSEAKDQPTLIRAMSKLPKDTHLVFVGEGPLIADNQKLANELGVSDRVHFLGFRQDIPRILKTVDIVVLSSHWEGFGIAAVEGMAAGNPVVASDVEGLSQVVKGAGVIFQKGDCVQLSEIIKNLSLDERSLQEIGSNCEEKSKKYDIDITLKKILNLYSKVKSSLIE